MLENKPMNTQEVFSPTGLLPEFVNKANQLCWQQYGFGMPVDYNDAQMSILGVEIVFNESIKFEILLELLRNAIIKVINSSANIGRVELDRF